MSPPPGQVPELVARAAAGDRAAIVQLLEAYRGRLRRMVAMLPRPLLPALVMVERDLAIDPSAVLRPPVSTLGHSRRLGDYCILGEIGRGGMGLVYDAEQVSLGRRVALKVLPPRVAQDSHALERFRREAKAAAGLHHTNIVPVFEVGQVGETAYYAMRSGMRPVAGMSATWWSMISTGEWWRGAATGHRSLVVTTEGTSTSGTHRMGRWTGNWSMARCSSARSRGSLGAGCWPRPATTGWSTSGT